jgi:hypothetical protein
VFAAGIQLVPLQAAAGAMLSSTLRQSVRLANDVLISCYCSIFVAFTAFEAFHSLNSVAFCTVKKKLKYYFKRLPNMFTKRKCE